MFRFNPEFQRHWVAALRSGEYEQGNGWLRIGNKFCCLGVACDISDEGVWLTDKPSINDFVYASNFEEQFTFLPASVTKRAGLPLELQERLVDMNDAGWTFNEIADAIEVLVP